MVMRYPWLMAKTLQNWLLLGAVALLASCGGSDGGSAGASSGATILSGKVADGLIEGAQVFLDLNGNWTHDAGEPLSAPTGPDGAYRLDVSGLSSTQLWSAMLVSHVPDSAKDADDKGKTLAEAGKSGYSLLAPVQGVLESNGVTVQHLQGAFLSPLTTLVAHEMAFNQLALGQARAQVQDAYALAEDPLSDFVGSADTDMARKAQILAIALGQAQQSASAEFSGSAIKDIQTIVAQSIRLTAPVLVTDGVLANNPAELLSQLKTEVKNKAMVLARQKNQDRTGGSGTVSYVVVFKDDTTDPTEQSEAIRASHGGVLNFRYSRALKGFSLTLPSSAAPAFLEAMGNHPKVDYVEADDAFQRHMLTEANAPWGLDRIDQIKGLNTTYNYNESGTGVRAYVVDTGIWAGHADFGGRVLSGFTAVSDGNGTSDCHGHGTHVAGTIGSSTYGVAKAVALVPVRVLDCSGTGSLSGLIAGLDWVMAHAVKPAVVNMSLGGRASISLDTAVSNTIASGMAVVVAAGNSGADACQFSPARVPAALTVGATTNADARAAYSNYGSCLDVFAPGSAITSLWFSSSSATKTVSGTSMASPHVAGVLALMLENNANATPAELVEGIKSRGTANVLSGTGVGSPNLFLYSLISSASAPVAAPVRSVAVAGLEATSLSARRAWVALVRIRVKDASGAAVSGAVLSGSFTAGGHQVSCTSSSSGECLIYSGLIRNGTATTTFSVTGIAGSAMQYTPGTNTATSITVAKPL